MIRATAVSALLLLLEGPPTSQAFSTSRFSISPSDHQPSQFKSLQADQGKPIAARLFSCVAGENVGADTEAIQEDGQLPTEELVKTAAILGQKRVFNLSLAGNSSTASPIKATATAGPNVSVSGKSRRSTLMKMTAGGFLLSQFLLRLLPIAKINAGRFAHFYLAQLAAFPIITKSITSAVIGIMGDVLAQRFEMWYARRSQAKDSNEKVAQTDNVSRYDPRRGLSVFADGLLVTGPFLHFAYEALERLVPIMGNPFFSPAKATMIQVLIDDLFLNTIFVALHFVSTAIGEGHVKDLPRQFRQDYIPTLKVGLAASIVLFPPAFACFRYMPLSLRVFGVNLISILWGGAVSFATHRNRR